MIPWPVVIPCALCFLVYLLIKTLGTIPSWRTIQLFNKLRGPTDQPFFIGASWGLRNVKPDERISYYKDKYDEFGGWYGCYSMGQPWLLVSDPEVIKVLLTDTVNINKGPEYAMLEKLIHRGLLLLSGKKWKVRRKLLTPSFHFEILQNSMESFTRNWRKSVDALIYSKGAPMEPQIHLKTSALNVINETAMGSVIEENGEAGQEYLEAVNRITPTTMKRMTTNWMKNDFLFHNFSSLSKSYLGDIKGIQDFVHKVIKARRAAFTEEKQAESLQYSESEDKKRRVFLDSLLELSTKEDFEDGAILDEVHTFMLVGHHTTMTAAQYLLMRIAENPEIQERAYQEQLEIFGESDRDATKDDLSKMRYLEKVIKETLRMNPPIPEISRLLIQDVTLANGQVVPEGTKVAINVFSTHRNPKYWDDPDTFNPDRFDLEKSKDRHPFSYIPFSAGPRNCIAFKFAQVNLKILGSLLLRNCQLSPVTRSEDLKYVSLITLQCTTPIKILVTPRSS